MSLTAKKKLRTDKEYMKVLKSVEKQTQLHILLPQSHYDKLRLKTLQKRTKVSKLVRKWVEKYISDMPD